MQGEVRLHFESEESARVAAEALAADDEQGVTTRLDGDQVVVQADADTIMGVLRGLDDALQCLRATGVD